MREIFVSWSVYSLEKEKKKRDRHILCSVVWMGETEDKKEFIGEIRSNAK